MTNRTALITGVLGQDGSLLAELLLSRGYRVVGIVRAGTALPTSGRLTHVDFVNVQLTDESAVRGLIDRWQPDEIYHLAAFHHASQDNSASAALAGKSAMLATNFLATKTLAFALTQTQSPCHLVFAASSQMFVPRRLTDEITEQSVRQPATFYGHTKAWSMDLLTFLRAESPLRASSAILFNHESTWRGAQFVSRKITRAAALAAAGKLPALELYNLATRVDWSSAHDVVEAMSLMGTADQPGDYVVASGILHSVRDLLEIAFSHVGLDWRKFTTVREDRETAALVGCTQALETSLGWQRKVSFKKMITEMVDHDIASSN